MDIYSRLDALPDSVRRHILDAIVGPPRPSPTSSEPPATSALSAATCAAARHGGPQPPKPPAAPAAVPGLKLVGGACVVDGFLSPDLVEDARQAAREALAERHRQAAIGGGLQLPGEGRAVDTQSRGDHMMWLHPQSADAAAGPGAAAARPPLQAVVAALEGVRRQLLRQGYDVGGSTTHQLAVYPGGGARYVRHADASLSCPTRAVTAIVYLNEQDWDPQVDGGCLALYNVPHATCMAHTTPPAAGPAAAPVQAAHAAPAADGAAGTGAAAAGAVPAALVPAEAAAAAAAETPAAATAAGAAAGATREPGRGAVARRGAAGTGLQCGEPAVLVAPLGGRLLVFESHLWHEVMPAHRHRYAITAWFHRTPPQQPPPPAASPQPPAPAPQAPQPTQLPQPPQPPAVPQVAVDATTAAPGTSTSTAPAAAPSPDCTSTSAAAAGADAAASPGPLGSLAAGQAPMPAEAASDRGGGMACVGRRPGRRRPRIFVSIAAYRDPECAWTLHSLFAAAAHPERVRVGVVWQVHPVEDVGLVRVAGAKSHPEWLQRVRQVVVPAAEATGPCKARALAQSLWDGEEYVLQLDSHMRMVPGWDELCIQQLAEAEALAERGKAVLSTYPLGYSGDGAAASCPDPATAPATLLCARGFEADGFLRTVGRELRQRPAAPVRCGFWAAGLSFARSAWLQEVPYCPALPHLFFGEEAYMAARGWTRGWDVYAPALPLAFHQWQRSSRQHTYQRDVRVAVAAGEKEVGEKEAGEKGEGGEEGGEERAEAAAALRRRSQARVLAVLRTGGSDGGEAGGGDNGHGAAFAGREQVLQPGRREEQEEQGQEEEGWPVGHVWGLGRERSLAELAAAFGVDYVRGEVVQPELASWGGLGPEAFVGGSSQ